MNTNTRNARVVISLILAMTAGARILLWLEPAPTITGRFTLTAMGGTPIEDVVIEYAQPGKLAAPGVLIRPDGSCDYEEQYSSHMRLVVVGTEELRLPEEQKQALLAALGSISWGRGGQGESPVISLDPNSDARLNPALRAQAHELCDMLVAKRFID